MAKKCKCRCKKGLPIWLGTFGDLMSLLLTFFVLLLSMATFDAKKLLEAEGSLQGAMSILDGGIRFEPSRERVQLQTPMVTQEETTDRVRKIESETIDYNEMTSVAQGPAKVLETGDDGFVLRLPTSALFEKKSAVLRNDDVKVFVKRIADIMERMPKDVKTNIIGFTDNTPLPPNSQYRDNLSLSANRALSVGKLLLKDGADPSMVQVSGEGSSNPIATNDTKTGREKNNRIEVRFEATKPENIGFGKSVLDSES